MRYSLDDLQTLFSTDALNHARLYLEQGQVAVPDIGRDGSPVTSLIQLPEQRPYRVYIRIAGDTAASIAGDRTLLPWPDRDHIAAGRTESLHAAVANRPTGGAASPV